MAFELDVLRVGEESKSGDAMVFRYGDLSNRFGHQVVVVDGGFQQSGHDLVHFIRSVYGTDRVDLVISTHPDADHSSGLRVVLSELSVGYLWMHRPWERLVFAAQLARLLGMRHFDEQLERSFATVAELEVLARVKSIPIVEPFAGVTTPDGVVVVLGPSSVYYDELIRSLEDSHAAAIRQISDQVARRFSQSLRRQREEILGPEALKEPLPDATRSQNNTSTVIFVSPQADVGLLLTADAGVPALERAIPPELAGQLWRSRAFFQIPHHGSKRNIGPAMLDRILPGLGPSVTAFVSAAEHARPKHPAQSVVNAVLRRGAQVLSNQRGNLLLRSGDAPARYGWGPAPPLEFQGEYEDD